MSRIAADGSTNVTVVDGSTYVGTTAPDGSLNVILADGTVRAGAIHNSGAWNVTVSDGSSMSMKAPDGSLYIQESPYTSNGQKVTVVSGSLDDSLLSVVFLDESSDIVNRTTYTFPTSLGTPSPGRRILIGVSARNGTTPVINSLTVAGVAAGSLGSILSGSNLTRTSMYMATVPTGTTGDIVITFSQEVERCGIGVWSVKNSPSTADATTSIVDPSATVMTVPVGGVAVAYGAAVHTSEVTATWAGLTENFDIGLGEANFVHTGASLAYPAGSVDQAMSVTWSATPATGVGVVFVTLGP